MNMRTLAALITCVAGSILSNAFAASKPDPANAAFFANPQKIATLALLVDTVMIESIGGEAGGIHRSDHDALVPVIAHGVKQAIENRGYRVTEVHANAGLFATADLKLVLADRNNKSTGENVPRPFYPSNVPEWAQGPIQSLMERVLTGAGPRRFSLSGPQRKPTGSFAIEVPPEIKALPVDAVAVVTSTVVNISRSEKVAAALGAGLVGVAGAAAGVNVGSGYELFGSAGVSSVNSAESSIVAIVDIRDGSVLWFDEGFPETGFPKRRRDGGIRLIRHTLVNMLVKLPNRNMTPGATTDVADNAASAQAAAETDEAAAADVPEGAEADQAVDTKNADARTVSFANARSIFVDPEGYSAAEVNRAYRAGAIPPDEFKRLRRGLELEYRDRLNGLKESLRSKKITEHENEIEQYRLEWSYRGFY